MKTNCGRNEPLLAGKREETKLNSFRNGDIVQIRRRAVLLGRSIYSFVVVQAKARPRASDMIQ